MNQELKKRIKIRSKCRDLSLFQGNFLIGSVQEVFCRLRFQSNRFKHLVKRFDRFGLTTLVGIKIKVQKLKNWSICRRIDKNTLAN